MHDSLTRRFPNRARSWQLGSRLVHFGDVPLVMGIVNVTPDSFSDGGHFLDPHAAVAHSLHLVEQGADLLDIGGESTRPYSHSISTDEELRRVMPVLQAVCEQVSVPVSIDTSKADVAREAMAAGAEIINDVTGLEGDPRMLQVAQETGAGLCVMHMRGTPQTMQDDPKYDNVVAEISQYLAERRASLEAVGIPVRRICLDPGIGFGKTHQHNLTLLANCQVFHDHSCPILVGHSRKGFLAKVLGSKDADRTAASVGVALSLARQGVQIIRVHDVRFAREALLLFSATGGIDGNELRIE